MPDLGNIATGFSKPSPKLVFVASNGGHLEQLFRWSESSSAADDSIWITFDGPQSRSLLADRPHFFVDDVPPRDVRAAMRAVPALRKRIAASGADGVVSTGAAIAVPAFFAAKTLRVPTRYVESVSRIEGPSLSGRMVSSLRLADSQWTQHERWADRRWRYNGNVLGQYKVHENPNTKVKKVFVTLGTLRQHRFDTLVRGVLDVLDVLEGDVEVVWQTGCTTGLELPGVQHDFMAPSEFDEEALSADVVVSHSGVGSVLRLLSMGVFPLLVPRRQQRDEQVDDHQEQIASLMAAHGLARVREADELTLGDLEFCTRRSVAPGVTGRG